MSPKKREYNLNIAGDIMHGDIMNCDIMNGDIMNDDIMDGPCEGLTWAARLLWRGLCPSPSPHTSLHWSWNHLMKIVFMEKLSKLKS